MQMYFTTDYLSFRNHLAGAWKSLKNYLGAIYEHQAPARILARVNNKPARNHDLICALGLRNLRARIGLAPGKAPEDQIIHIRRCDLCNQNLHTTFWHASGWRLAKLQEIVSTAICTRIKMSSVHVGAKRQICESRKDPSLTWFPHHRWMTRRKACSHQDRAK